MRNFGGKFLILFLKMPSDSAETPQIGIVIDVNQLLEKLEFIKTLSKKLPQNISLYIPNTVTEYIESNMENETSKAGEFVGKIFEEYPRVRVQQIFEQTGFGLIETQERIVDACRYWVENISPNLILLSDDKSLSAALPNTIKTIKKYKGTPEELIKLLLSEEYLKDYKEQPDDLISEEELYVVMQDIVSEEEQYDIEVVTFSALETAEYSEPFQSSTDYYICKSKQNRKSRVLQVVPDAAVPELLCADLLTETELEFNANLDDISTKLQTSLVTSLGPNLCKILIKFHGKEYESKLEGLKPLGLVSIMEMIEKYSENLPKDYQDLDWEYLKSASKDLVNQKDIKGAALAEYMEKVKPVLKLCVLAGVPNDFIRANTLIRKLEGELALL
jgi:hypothetical protein